MCKESPAAVGQPDHSGLTQYNSCSDVLCSAALHDASLVLCHAELATAQGVSGVAEHEYAQGILDRLFCPCQKHHSCTGKLSDADEVVTGSVIGSDKKATAVGRNMHSSSPLVQAILGCWPTGR